MLKIADLINMKEIIKINTLCRLAKIPIGTMNGKIQFQRELKVDESERITEVLKDFGLSYKPAIEKETTLT